VIWGREVSGDANQNPVTWTRPFLHELLEAIPVSVNSLIDVGCGKGIVGALMRIYRNATRLVGVDIFPPYIKFCKKYHFYDEVYAIDLRKIPLPFKNEEFEVATCIEVIEHLPKEDGEKMLGELERIAQTVMISTPSHYFSQPGFDDNPYRTHFSKWSARDFRKRGYKVKGVGSFTVHHLPVPVRKISSNFPHLFQHLLAKRDKS